MLNALGMLNFSFVQIFNQLNENNNLVDCENNTFFLVLSYSISFCYIFAPFAQSCYLVFVLRYIAKVNEEGGLENDEDELDGETNSQIDDNSSFQMGSQNTKYTGHNFNNNIPSDSKNGLLGLSGFGKGGQFGRSGSV